jgi:glucokinase
VDVGGTKIAAGVVSPEGTLLKEVKHPTANVRERLLESIAGAIEEVAEGYEVGGVCLAVPGYILAQENKVLSAANLEAIEGIPLKEELGERSGLTVTVENDANAAAWGEFRFGVGKDVDDLILVTLGTGVGGGVISHGVLLRRLMHNCSDQQVGQVTQWSTELEVEVLPAGVGGDLRR